MDKCLYPPLLEQAIEQITEFWELLDDLDDMNIRAADMPKNSRNRMVEREDPGWSVCQSLHALVRLFLCPLQTVKCSQRIPHSRGKDSRKALTMRVVLFQILCVPQELQDKHTLSRIVFIEVR